MNRQIGIKSEHRNIVRVTSSLDVISDFSHLFVFSQLPSSISLKRFPCCARLWGCLTFHPSTIYMFASHSWFCHWRAIVTGPNTSIMHANIITQTSKIFWPRVTAVSLRWQRAGSMSTLVMPKIAPAMEMTLSSLSATNMTTTTVRRTSRLLIILTFQNWTIDSPILGANNPSPWTLS